jgi:hypothetical protein
VTRLASVAAGCLLCAGAATSCGGGGGDKAAKPTAARARPTTYRASFYTARPPAGWRLVLDEKHLTDTLVRTKWAGPGELGAEILIDAVKGGGGSPTGRAESVRAKVGKRPGYHERAFEDYDLGDKPAKVWSYDRGPTRVVDWLFDQCGDGFAVQGSAPAAGFGRYEAVFQRVAESVRSACD